MKQLMGQFIAWAKRETGKRGREKVLGILRVMAAVACIIMLGSAIVSGVWEGLFGGPATSRASGQSGGGTYTAGPAVAGGSQSGSKVCRICNGYGKVSCDTCNGSGKRWKERYVDGRWQSYQVDCSSCNGRRQVKCRCDYGYVR